MYDTQEGIEVATWLVSIWINCGVMLDICGQILEVNQSKDHPVFKPGMFLDGE